MELYDWHRQIVLGEVVRKDGSIIVLDRQGNEVARWNFVRAWPTKYDIPDFNASGNEVAIETLELAHEGVERVG
jgi:phage tail-like protein